MSYLEQLPRDILTLLQPYTSYDQIQVTFHSEVYLNTSDIECTVRIFCPPGYVCTCGHGDSQLRTTFGIVSSRRWLRSFLDDTEGELYPLKRTPWLIMANDVILSPCLSEILLAKLSRVLDLTSTDLTGEDIVL